MKTLSGFTLIELVIFIVGTTILVAALLLTFQTTLSNTPSVHYNLVAGQLADQCMEGFIGQRRLNGFTNSNFSCGTPTLPAVCTAPSGYSVSATITCSPTLSGDSTTSRTLTVTVSGNGNVSLSTLLASY